LSATARLIRLVAEIQSLPYRWPSPPTAASARAERAGTCASKHALLSEELGALGVFARPVLCVGPLVPEILAGEADLQDAADLREVHELLTVDHPDVGPLRVDVTWDPPLIRAGLSGTLDWDGRSDMAPAVGPVVDWYAPDPARLRSAKEQLRGRLYSGNQRARRDAVIAAMSSRFESIRRRVLG
jgi:hypothetical protein